MAGSVALEYDYKSKTLPPDCRQTLGSSNPILQLQWKLDQRRT
jgi:hypothetical protein